MGFIADLIRGRRGKNQAEEDRLRFTEQKDIALGEEADFYKDEESGKFDTRVSQAQRDLATSGMKKQDDSAIKAREVSELAALANDPRALMGGIAGTRISLTFRHIPKRWLPETETTVDPTSETASDEDLEAAYNAMLADELGMTADEVAASVDAQKEQEAQNEAKAEALKKAEKEGENIVKNKICITKDN